MYVATGEAAGGAAAAASAVAATPVAVRPATATVTRVFRMCTDVLLAGGGRTPCCGSGAQRGADDRHDRDPTPPNRRAERGGAAPRGGVGPPPGGPAGPAAG